MLKRILFLISLGVLIYLFWPLLRDVRASFDLLRQIRVPFVVLALTFQLLGYACLSWLNLLCLTPFPGRISLWRMMATNSALAFVQTVLPSAGASGVALRLRLLGNHGYSAEAATFSMLLETALLSVTLLLFSSLALVYLLQWGGITAAQVGLFVAALLLLGYLGRRLLRFLGNKARFRQWVLRTHDRLSPLLRRLNRPVASSRQVTRRFNVFYRSLRRLRRSARWPFALAAVGRVACDIASLACAFAAFDYVIRPANLVTGYGLASVVSWLGAVPGALGLADASMPVIFDQLGVPGPTALAASLVYRLLSYWLVRLAGFLALRLLEREQEEREKGAASSEV